MRKQLKSIVVAGMIATLSFATLAGCGSKSTAKNDETTISDTVKQTQKQTEKTTDATTGAATEAAVTTENTDVDNTTVITSEPDVNAESNEPDYEVSYEPDVPAYVPDTPVDIPDSTPADEPVDNTPAPTEPATHEHNWVPVKYYAEWITSTEPNSHVRWHDKHGNERTDKHTYSNALGVDHYECECGETKTGEDHDKLQDIINTKEISEDGLFYYRNNEEYSYPYRHTQSMYEYSATKIK